MIYLDYAANTPVAPEVLKCFSEAATNYIANPNSAHGLGREAKAYMEKITRQLAEAMGVKESEIIFTSGASESNNLTIKGIAGAYRSNGKHIISTPLEHSSVSGTLTALQAQGYEIDLVEVLEDGRVNLEHLKELLRQDTILVSIGYVDSELGVEQPIKAIKDCLAAYPNCYFHTDATQAIGKIAVDLTGVDCISFAPHKFFGLNGCGVLIKKEGVRLEPLIHGGLSTTTYRSGTPALALAASTVEAVHLALPKLEERYQYVENLNQKLQDGLKAYPLVRINSTSYSVPYILNLSVKGVKAAKFQEALQEQEVYVSTKSACSVMNTPSYSVLAVTKDRKNAMSSWRISLSHLTTEEEVEAFMRKFDGCYQALTN